MKKNWKEKGKCGGFIELKPHSNCLHFSFLLCFLFCTKFRTCNKIVITNKMINQFSIIFIIDETFLLEIKCTKYTKRIN